MVQTADYRAVKNYVKQVHNDIVAAREAMLKAPITPRSVDLDTSAMCWYAFYIIGTCER
jgi:hypothetical protein